MVVILIMIINILIVTMMTPVVVERATLGAKKMKLTLRPIFWRTMVRRGKNLEDIIRKMVFYSFS